MENIAALALATHTLLIKTLAVLKADGVVSSAQMKDALQRSYALLEEDATDQVAIKARVMLESLEDDLAK